MLSSGMTSYVLISKVNYCFEFYGSVVFIILIARSITIHKGQFNFRILRRVDIHNVNANWKFAR
jgi:hypothetical protein